MIDDEDASPELRVVSCTSLDRFAIFTTRGAAKCMLEDALDSRVATRDFCIGWHLHGAQQRGKSSPHFSSQKRNFSGDKRAGAFC